MQKILSILPFLVSVTYTFPAGSLDFGLSNAIVAGGNALSQIGKQAQQLQESQSSLTVPGFGPFGRERAVLESESKLSQFDSKYTYAHNFIADIIRYKPIIDTIQEHEKYGNDGAKSRRIATAIIDGFDGIANVVNAALDIPYDKAAQFSKTATAALNKIGGSLVGL